MGIIYALGSACGVGSVGYAGTGAGLGVGLGFSGIRRCSGTLGSVGGRIATLGSVWGYVDTTILGCVVGCTARGLVGIRSAVNILARLYT